MIRFWNAATGMAARPPLRRNESRTAVSFAADGKKLLVGSDFAVQLLDGETGKPLGKAAARKKKRFGPPS